MSGFDFSAKEENQLFEELDAYERRRQTFVSQASPELAMTIADFYRMNPDTSPGLIMAAAKAKQAGQLTDEQFGRISLDVLKRETQEATQKKEKSWWERNVYDKLKTGSRWTLAGLEFLPQMVQGAAAQIFDDNDSVAGWFISTDLGSLIANDEVAGEGFFIGGRAAELQAERARRYRGEIDGKAFTIGRGIAHHVAQPGSREYNIVSGLFDAAAAIATPSAPGFKVARGAAQAGVAKTGLTRSLVGLTDFESAYIIPRKVSAFLDSASGQKMINKLASTDSFDQMLSIMPRVIDTDFLLKVTKESNPTQIRNLLDESLGLKPGMQNIADINLSRLSDTSRLLGRNHTVGKLMAKTPGRHLVIVGDNIRDINDSVRNMNEYLKLLKRLPNETSADWAKRRTNLVKDYADALLGNNGDVFATGEQFYKVLSESLVRNGVPPEAVGDMTAKLKRFGRKDVYGILDEAGDPTSLGAKVQLPNGDIVDKVTASAMLQSEAIQQAGFILPDPRRVRRMSSKLGWVTGKRSKLLNPDKYGELRMPVSAIEFYQNELWRPITLATGGYSLRNLTEAAFMYSFAPGVKGGVFHPIHWIQTAMYKGYRGDIEGKAFDEIPEEVAEGILRKHSTEYTLATNQRMREAIDPVTLERRGFSNQLWRPVKRTSDTTGEMFTKGVRNEINLLRDDPLAVRIASSKADDPIQDAIDWLKGTDEGRDYLRGVAGREKNKYLTNNNGQKALVTPEYVKETPTGRVYNDFNIEQQVRQIAERIRRKTGNNQRLREAIATGEIEVNGKKFDIYKRTKSGDPNGYSDEFIQATREIVDDGVTELDVWYKMREDTMESFAGDGKQRARVFKGLDDAFDSLFGELYPKREAFLARSPAFRQFYYSQIGRMIDELDETGLLELRARLADVAKKTKGFDPKNPLKTTKDIERFLGQYIGDYEVSKSILRKIANPKSGRGKLTFEELNAYAKGFALDEVKRTFFDAAQKSNFADILRIVAPFGSAWADVVSRWSRLLSSEPEALKRIGMSVQGFRDADPDADGKGFFWKDPVTGEYMFNYPFNKQIGPLVSYLGGMGALAGGVFGGAKGIVAGGAAGLAGGAIAQGLYGVPGTELVAPAKSLNMSLNIIPGLGPFVQLSASKILGQMPQADDIMKIITPYGEPSVPSFGPIPIPSWAQKITAALSDPENNRLLGDMTIETMRVLQLQGGYDLTKPEDVQRLEADAIDRARILIMLRGIGQFVGPTRPDVEFKVETYEGDKYTAELSKAFRDMQAQNYDTAVLRFLNAFGEDALLYVSGKTKSTVGGLDATTQFGEFERENPDLFAQYRDVAGFFAPAGSNFDYAVYLRQLRRGDRERLSPKELVEEAQSLVGRALYRTTVQSIGPNPTSDQQDYLRSIRELIKERFPGFATAAININEASARLDQVQQVVFSNLLEGNPIIEPARIYFQQRELALQEAETRGLETLKGKAVADLRAWLRDIGDQLVRQYPGFERLYDRVLFNEIDLDSGGTL